jgi:hypothetical protein
MNGYNRRINCMVRYSYRVAMYIFMQQLACYVIAK